MSVSKIRLVIFMFILGLVFLSLDIYINTGLDYPEDYRNDTNIIGEFQYYNIRTFYGASCTFTKLGHVDATADSTDTQGSNTSMSNSLYEGAEFVDDVFFDGFRIDIFNDVLGLLLIALSCLILSKYKPIFRLAVLLAIISIIIKSALTVLPFFLNGMPLCNMALGVGTSYVIATVITSFFGVRGFINLIQDYCCRDERVWINTVWFVSAILIILIYLLSWLNLYGMAHFFTGVLIIDYILCGLILKRVDEFAAKNCKA